MNHLTLWGITCLAVSGGFLFSALRIYLRRKQFLAASQPAAGTITEVHIRGVGRNATSFPVFEFRTADGTIQQAESLMGTGLQRFGVGEAVAVRYDPRNPRKAEVDSFAVLWGLALLRAGFGLLFLIMGIVGLVLGG